MEETENIQPQPEVKPKKKSLFKKIKRIALYFLILLVVLISTAFILASVYEKEIKQYAISEINKYLVAEIKVNDFDKDITFSFIKKFPKASLSFNNIVILGEKKDTVLFANNISLEFSILSIFSGDYTVNEIDVENTLVNLVKDEKGKENYIIWKQSTETEDENTPFKFDLKDLNFKNVTIKYTDKVSHFKSDILFKKTNLSGSFTNTKVKFDVKSNHHINSIASDSLVYFSDKSSTANLIMEIDNVANNILIKKGDLTIQEMELDVTGNYNFNRNTYKLLANTKNVKISNIFSLLPKNINDKLQEYATKGVIEGKAVIEQFEGNKVPNITAKFDIKDGTLTEKTTKATLTNLVIDGKYTLTPSSQDLEILNVSGNISGGQFKGSIKILGTKTLTIFSKLEGNVNLKSVAELLNFENIENLEGDIIFSNNFRGTTIYNGELRVTEFSGKTDLKNVALKLVGKKYSLANLSGDFNFNQYTSTGTFKGDYGASDFSLSCQVKNIIQYFTQNQILEINTYLQSNELVLDEVMMLIAKETDEKSVSNTQTDSSFYLPQKVKSNISANIGTLTYGKHVLNQFKGNVFISPNGIESKNISFKANNGIYALSGKMLPAEKEGFKLTGEAICSNIDVNDFFNKFDNFGQNILEARHLKGKTDATISLAANLNKKLEIDLNSLLVTTDFTIINGELIGFEMFDEIADYIRGNVVAKTFVKVDMLAEKLRHVKFDKMTNQIEIRDQKIILPDMLIKSSAMDIGMYGTQTFAGEINYGINFRLADVLTNKKPSEFGYIKDDGTGTRMFLSMFGTIDEPQFKMDSEAKKRFIDKKKLDNNSNLKSILKNEFGFFKTDTTVNGNTTTPVTNSPRFEIEWDEEEKPKTDVKTQKKEKPEPEEEEKEKKKGWLQKLTDKNKEEPKKVGFEVE